MKHGQELESLIGKDGFASFRWRDGEVDAVREGHIDETRSK